MTVLANELISNNLCVEHLVKTGEEYVQYLSATDD